MNKHDKRKKKRREKKHKERNTENTPKKYKPIDDIAKQFAEIMMKIGEADKRAVAHLKYKKFFCSICKQHFCYNELGKEEFCSTCFLMEHKAKKCSDGMFFTGCSIEPAGARVCKECSK